MWLVDTPKYFPSSVHNRDVNCAPRSEMICRGTPKRLIQPLMNVRATSVDVVSFKRYGLWSSGTSVYACQQISVTLHIHQRSYDIHIDYCKSIGWRILLQWAFDVLSNLTFLASRAGSSPLSNLLFHSMPYESASRLVASLL